MILHIMDATTVKVAAIPEEKDILWDILSYTKPTKLPHYGGKFAYVKSSYFNKVTNSFGYGLLRFVKRKLRENDVHYEVRRIAKSKILDYKEEVKFEGITLEKYQSRTFEKVENFKRGIIEAPTAAGKTIIIAGLIKKYCFPRTLVIVPTSDIARNTVKELTKLLKISIAQFGGGSKEFKRITVILYQSLRELNIKPLNDNTELIIVDEVHMAVDAIKDILEKFPNVWYRYGLSATPISSVKKKEWFPCTSQLGERLVIVTEKQASARVSPVEAYMFPFKGKSTFENYLDSYRPDVILNKNRCNLLGKMTKWALEKKKVENVFILVDEYQQAKIIHKILEKDYNLLSTIAHSKVSNEDLEQIKKDFNNKKLKVLIATPVFGTGTNIPEIECIIMGSARKSLTNTIQKVGRGRRKTVTKQSLLLLDIYDIIGNNDKFFQKFSERRLSLYKRKKWFKEFIDI